MKSVVYFLVSILVLAVMLFSMDIGANASDTSIDSVAVTHTGEVRGIADRSPYIGNHTGYRPSYMVLGDSITWYGEPSLRELGARWEVSAVPGRDVSNLGAYVRDRLANPSPLKMLVIALGTNATPGWYQADYQRVVDMLPASTKVVFVTTYRDPIIWNNTYDYRRRAAIQPHYSAFMKSIAASRSGTGIADWREYISIRPNLLRDGTHPTLDRGVDAWAKLVVNAVHATQ